MKRRLLAYLACPLDGGTFELSEKRSSAEDVETGELVCDGCGRTFAIVRGVPRLVPPGLTVEQQRTADAFGWQWQHFVEMVPRYEQQFLDWIEPIGPDAFHDKVVLDAGCGIGRHASFAAQYGARDVVAIDLSASVETAQSLLRDFPNVHVVQGDILRPPFRRDSEALFDLAYSIGVVHHLPAPAEGIRSLTSVLRPGGTLAVWVYGHENNEFVRSVIEPLRSFTTRIPPPLLRGIAWPVAVAFHAVVKGIYRPARGTWLNRRLPLADYISSLTGFKFRQNYNIVFDQLVAPTAAYVRKEELEEWFAGAGLEAVGISHRHGNSWRARGRRPSEVAPH